jgi:hypothetical protein
MWSLFRDNNKINEKYIIGFIAFFLMVSISIIDVVMAIMEKTFSITQYIYDSFVIIVLGIFGINEAGKIYRDIKNKKLENIEEE